jgi:uncharacterized SAM-binding protein YcdF (DUF218 family)
VRWVKVFRERDTRGRLAGEELRRVTRYDYREIRLRRGFEQFFENLGERALELGLDDSAGWLARPLEVPADLTARPFIVVLSGGIRSTGRLNATTVARVEWAVELYRRSLGERLVMSGGPRRPGRPPSAPAMKRLAADLGVPGEQILVEAASSRTAENARDVAALLRTTGRPEVLLVTSPLHMRRAKLCFERSGVAVSPAPVPRVDGEPPERSSILAQTLHEYTGLLYYRLRGWL